jgi:hypothetical protein
MQDRRELRTLRSQLDASTSPRGAGCESKPSWLPPHKTRMAANSLQAREKNAILSTRESLTIGLTCSILLTSQGLLTQQILRQEQHIRRTLCQSPHKVGIPLGAERDVDARAPALFHQGLLQVAPDAV